MLIEQGNTRGQRVKNRSLTGCFALQQMLLAVSQQHGKPLFIRHRINFTVRKFLQSLICPQERFNRLHNRLALISGQSERLGLHAASRFKFNAANKICVSSTLPTILHTSGGSSVISMGVSVTSSSWARPGSRNTSFISISWRSGKYCSQRVDKLARAMAELGEWSAT